MICFRRFHYKGEIDTKRCFLLLMVLLLSFSFISCAFGDSAQDRENTLWVVTEVSSPDGMNLQLETIVQRMQEAYPDLTINIEFLPLDDLEREARLKKLRTQVMSGRGPDVFLLPTGTDLKADERYSKKIHYTVEESLFSDVAQAMRNGVFLDISEYYDADTELNTAALKQEIMEAGCLNGCRYVLPLRFQVPVVYTRPDLCAEYGITEEMLESDFLTLAASVLALEDAQTAAIGLKFPENPETFGDLMDYGRDELLISQEVVETYLTLYQNRQTIAAQSTQEFYDKWDLNRRLIYFTSEVTLLSEIEYSDEEWDRIYGRLDMWPERGGFYHECFNMLGEYVENFYHWSTCDIPLYTGRLSDILETIGVTKLTGQEVEVYPLRDGDGAVQASVTYWGAVCSSCTDPELAYTFLRQFLEEEFQWDIYRPRANRSGAYWTWEIETQAYGQVEDSYPVRTDGCVEYLWDNLIYQISWMYRTFIPEIAQNRDNVSKLEITNADVPELDWAIDRVYFPISQDEEETLSYALGLLNEEDGTPTDVGIPDLAQDVWKNLWWHLAEG